MFVTNDSASLTVDEGHGHPDEYWWHYVTILANTPYFVTSYKTQDRLCCDILSNVWQLRRLMLEPTVELLDVWVLHGELKPGKFGWKNGRLRSVLKGTEPGKDSAEAIVLTFDQGTSLVVSENCTNESGLSDITEWFSIPHNPSQHAGS